jgi:alpha-glucosidase (family GH31 glycosyl hydrolase)
MSAAETWVDLVPREGGKIANFISESVILEMFLFTSIKPKGISKKLAMVTGYQALPPYYSLGFHYSKWEEGTSASGLIT